jgi:hypothetical protein
MAMSEPAGRGQERDRDGDERPKRRVQVPTRRGDLFDGDEFAYVDVDVAGQWDERCWRDRP